MEGYEIYRLSDEEIQHFGVKGMKWGKRKSRSSYMRKVDAHENKTKSVAAAKATSGKSKRKAYMDAVNAHETKGQKIRDAKAQEKTDKKSANSYMGKVRAHENKTKAVAAAKSESGKAKRKAYMDAVNAHEKKGQDIRDAKSNEKRLKKQISEAKKKNLTPEERKARNVKIAKVTAGVAITAGVVVGAAYIYKYKHLPAKAANDQAKARVLEAMKRNMEKSVAESLKNTNVDRAAQTIRKQAASKVASAVTLGKSSKGNTLDDILKQTEHFADLMNKGTLSAGQSASWQALNEEMIEIFKQTNNPYM